VKQLKKQHICRRKKIAQIRQKAAILRYFSAIGSV
jgi:hypothetical protein